MNYCTRCMYPSNAKPVIVFDELGVCSGCRYVESRKNINWEEREQWLSELLNKYKDLQKLNIDNFKKAWVHAKKYGVKENRDIFQGNISLLDNFKKYIDNYLIVISCSTTLRNKIKNLCLKLFPDSTNKKQVELENTKSFKYK